jgi:prolyl-tRNA synthetase
LEAKNITVKYDDRDSQRSGWKFHEYELKGVPVRITIGPRDLENNQVEIFRRDTLEKQNYSIDNLPNIVDDLLNEIQQNMYNKALVFRDENIRKADTWEEFVSILENKGGFVYAHWDGTTQTEELIKEKTKATIRCIPFDNPQEDGKCILTGKPSKERVMFAKAY